MQHSLNTPRRPDGDPRKLLDDLYSYVGIMRRGWRLIVLAILVATTASFIYVSRFKTFYRASTRLLVIQQGGRPIQVPGGADAFSNSQMPYSLQSSNESLATHVMIIKSPVVVGRAIAKGGLGGVAIGSLIGGLSVKLPDETARVVEISFASESPDVAKRVVDGVSASYNEFLKQNYQKNTNEVITLIVKARDDLSKELKSLEQEYLTYRQKNPAYSADEKGRTFIVRRLDQWDQVMNQVLSRSLQIKSQLDLGRRLANEGADDVAISAAINQLSLLGSAGTPVTPPPTAVPTVTGARADEELAALETQSSAAEKLRDHLRLQLQELEGENGATRREIDEALAEDPEVIEAQGLCRALQARVRDAERRARSPGDASVVAIRKRLTDQEGELRRLIERRRPAIAKRLARESTAGITAEVRKIDGELIVLKARTAALRERGEQATTERLKAMRQEQAKLARLHGPDHSSVNDVRQRIADLEGTRLDDSAANPSETKTRAVLASVEQSLQSLEAMRAELQKKFEEELDNSKKTEISQLEETNLRNNLDRQRTLFFSVVDQLKQAQMVSDFGSVSAQMLSPTGVAAERPNQDLVMVMALFAGCGLGGVAAVVADLLDARVRTLAEIRAQLDLPVIGLIPQLSAEQSKATGPIGLLSHQAPRSALAESYKSTRTNLEFLRRARRSQVLLISSAHSGDGKSTTSSNLAITLAQSGRRVLLIDGDLRKPSLHTIYNQHRDRGLTSLLEGDQSVAAAAEPTLVEHLDLVTTGPDTANPAELLASHRLAEILEEARKLYEIIIIDSSSLLAVTDPSIIAAVIDGIILVVRISSTRRYDVERTMELVNTLGIPALGVVVNGITRDQVGFAYGGHGYGNGYGRGKRRPHGAPPEVKNGEGRVSGPPAPPSPGVNGRITNDRGPSDHSSSN